MGIFYREKIFYSGKKSGKNDFAPSEKYSCYTPGTTEERQNHNSDSVLFNLLEYLIC